eukprot:6774210-Lingulodinium_polyedra.AAC.1
MGEQEVLEELKKVSSQIFQGWGQSKVIEDSLNRLRDRETRDTKQKTLQVRKQLALLSAQQ